MSKWWLASLCLLTLLATGAQGCATSQKPEFRRLPWKEIWIDPEEKGIVIESNPWVIESDTDRFLREQVQPEIEAGDKIDCVSYYDRSLDNEKHIEVIKHYMKALVLIETEKLRRDSK